MGNERFPYYSPELSRQSPEFDAPSAKHLLKLLKSSELAEMIQAGDVTLAMVRPNVGPEANLLGLPDDEAADKIEGMIKGLGVMAKFSTVFSPDVIEEFYGGGPQENMDRQSARDPNKFNSRWPEFISDMTSGPTTFILLHSPDHDAIKKWRTHLGHWNIDANRDPSTIRGQLGVNIYNNLVHGSDAPESVLREVDIISHQLERSIAKEHIRKQLDSYRDNKSEAEWLSEIGLLDDPDEIYDLIPHTDWQRGGGETYVMDFTIAAESQQTRLIAKACVKMSPSEAMSEWLGRRQLLAESGLVTPTIYASDGATLLEEYIPFTFKEAYAQADDRGKAVLRESFVEAYFTLHDIGFRPISLHDLRSHGNDVVFIDFGSDLGGPTATTESHDMIEKAAKALTEAVNGV